MAPPVGVLVFPKTRNIAPYHWVAALLNMPIQERQPDDGIPPFHLLESRFISY